jgi:predicted transcriptional regulator of viral defense system
VDVLDNPSLGGGIKHTAEVLLEYFSGEHRNDRLLIGYVTRLRNRTVHKRLGYLVETLAIDAPDIIKFCKRNLSAGYSKLDPAIRTKGRLVRRWNLEVNVRIT